MKGRKELFIFWKEVKRSNKTIIMKRFAITERIHVITCIVSAGKQGQTIKLGGTMVGS